MFHGVTVELSSDRLFDLYREHHYLLDALDRHASATSHLFLFRQSPLEEHHNHKDIHASLERTGKYVAHISTVVSETLARILTDEADYFSGIIRHEAAARLLITDKKQQANCFRRALYIDELTDVPDYSKAVYKKNF